MRMLSAAMAALCLFAAGANAQQAAAPQWVPGTVCVFQMTQVVVDGVEKNRAPVRYNQQVNSVSGGEITLTVGASNTKRVVTPEGNAVMHGNIRFSPAYQTYSFPMSVGKQWSGSGTQDIGSTRATYKLYAAVSSYENVVVPAGNMPAFRIDINAEFTASNGTSKAREVIWYSPAVGRLVKSEYVVFAANGTSIQTRTLHELHGCSIK